MTNIRIDKIQIKRGTVANLPILADGELFYAYDTKEHYLGMGGVNQLLSKNFVMLNQHYESVLSRFGINSSGKLTIDSVEVAGGGGDGKSAYQLWLDQGNTGTVQNFLNSLVGPQGPQGPAGTGGSGGGSLSYSTLSELQTAYPNGTTQPVWIVSENSWYYWDGVIDTTAPTLTITPGGTFATTKTVTLTTNETATIYYTLDGSTPTTASLVYSTPLSVSATTTLKAFAKDASGNESAVQSVVYTLDTTPPINVTNLAISNQSTTGLTLTWTAVSDAASYDVYNGATLLTNVTGTTYSVTGLTQSTQYTFTVKAKDAAGNIASGSSVTGSTTAPPPDTTAPVLTITPAGTFTDTQTVTMTTNETATIWYTLDDSDPTTSGTKLQYTAPLTLTATDTIKAYAVDSANNASAVQTVTYTKLADTTPPTVTASPVAGTYASTQSVTLSANETAAIYYTLDGSTPTTASAVYSAPLSISANTTLKYFGKDAAGNSSTVQTAIYNIDTTAPDPVTSLTAGVVTANSIPISWVAPSASDVAKYEVAYSSNGGTSYTIATSNLTAPATSYTVNSLTFDTSYVIRVVAIDGVGNRSTATTVNTATLSSVIVSDSFDRANSSTTLGSTNSYLGGTSKTWTPLNSTLWGIDTNKAYIPTPTTDDAIVIDSGASDVNITLDITFASNEGIIFRAVDNNNYFLVNMTSSSTTLFQKQGGTFTNISNKAVARTVGTIYTLEIICKGSTITVKENGVELFPSKTNTSNQTATLHGIRSGATNASKRFDNFVVKLS